MNQDKEEWYVYTDGACEPNPGPGGFGFYARKKNNEIYWTGFHSHTTNNRMEYQAAIEALKILPQNEKITIYSDSQLLVKTMTEWVHSWIQKEILDEKKNNDLIYELLDLTRGRWVLWEWVKGHSGNIGNEIADYLANYSLKTFKHEFSGPMTHFNISDVHLRMKVKDNYQKYKKKFIKTPSKVGV